MNLEEDCVDPDMQAVKDAEIMCWLCEVNSAVDGIVANGHRYCHECWARLRRERRQILDQKEADNKEVFG